GTTPPEGSSRRRRTSEPSGGEQTATTQTVHCPHDTHAVRASSGGSLAVASSFWTGVSAVESGVTKRSSTCSRLARRSDRHRGCLGQRTKGANMKIVVVGGSGLIGKKLVN